MNQEVDQTVGGADVIGYITLLHIAWIEHVAWMFESKMILDRHLAGRNKGYV